MNDGVASAGAGADDSVDKKPTSNADLMADLDDDDDDDGGGGGNEGGGEGMNPSGKAGNGAGGASVAEDWVISDNIDWSVYIT